MARLLKVFFLFCGYLLLFNIVGDVVTFLLSILPFESITNTLFYVCWFVGGVFCGLFAYDKAGRILLPVTEGDWAGASESGRVGLITLAMAAIVETTIFLLCYKLVWQHGRIGTPSLTDQMWMTITYLCAVLGSMIFGHVVIRPSTVSKSSSA